MKVEEIRVKKQSDININLDTDIDDKEIDKLDINF